MIVLFNKEQARARKSKIKKQHANKTTSRQNVQVHALHQNNSYNNKKLQQIKQMRPKEVRFPQQTFQR